MNPLVADALKRESENMKSGQIVGARLRDLRDKFASEALQGLLARGEPLDDPAGLTNLAYTLADAMLVARKTV